MPQLNSNSTTTFFSIGGSWGDIDITSSTNAITVSLNGRTHDVTGWPRASNALVNLSVADARKLAKFLQEAASAADNVEDPRQIGFWSNATTFGCVA